MPLKKGFSKTTLKKNFHELRHGPTYAKTKRKEGKVAADKQMQAIALSEQKKAMKKAGRKPKKR